MPTSPDRTRLSNQSGLGVPDWFEAPDAGTTAPAPLLGGGAERVALLFCGFERRIGLLLRCRPCRLRLLLRSLIASLDLLLGGFANGLRLLLSGLLGLGQCLGVLVERGVGLVEGAGGGLRLRVRSRQCRLVGCAGILLHDLRGLGGILLGLLRNLPCGLERGTIGRNLLFGGLGRVVDDGDLGFLGGLDGLLVLGRGRLRRLRLLLRGLARGFAGLQRRLQQRLRLLLGGLSRGRGGLLGSLLRVS